MDNFSSLSCYLCWPLLFLPAVSLCYVAATCYYNVFLHPYAKFPGPACAKLSPLYALWHAYAGDLHIDVLRCHDEYGPIVRYAPDRIIINTVSGVRAIYGQGGNVKKSKGYAPHPYFPKVFNTHNCIDKAMHGRKRRIVSQAFSEAAISSSEQYILDHVRSFCDGLLTSVDEEGYGWSKAHDMGMWTNYFTLDVISDLTFGQPFKMLTSPDLRWLVEAIVNGNRHIYMRFAFPALFNVKPNAWYSLARWLFPTMAKDRTRFAEIAAQYSRERMEAKSDRRDIMSALLAARDPKTGDQLTEAEVWGEAHLMIAAGGDTTSTALAAVLFYLSRSKEAYRKLADEIRTTFRSAESIRRGKQLSSCRYLRACLDEALRLAPAAPGALWREVGDGGLALDGHQIPAGYDVAVCTYALHHNAEYFPEPFAFRPERCLEDHSNKTAFAPFALGPRSCLAKPLAYLELSLALARLVWLMDFEAVDSTGAGGPGLGRGRERIEEFQIVDMFSSNKQGPVLRFRARVTDE